MKSSEPLSIFGKYEANAGPQLNWKLMRARAQVKTSHKDEESRLEPPPPPGPSLEATFPPLARIKKRTSFFLRKNPSTFTSLLLSKRISDLSHQTGSEDDFTFSSHSLMTSYWIFETPFFSVEFIVTKIIILFDFLCAINVTLKYRQYKYPCYSRL